MFVPAGFVPGQILQAAKVKIWLSTASCDEVLMAAELQYRAMDVGYKVSYPYFTQTSHEEGLPETLS